MCSYLLLSLLLLNDASKDVFVSIPLFAYREMNGHERTSFVLRYKVSAYSDDLLLACLDILG